MLKVTYSARIFVIMLVLVVVLAGCRDSGDSDDDSGSAEATITVSYDPNPPAVGDATLMVTLTDANGDPINDATVNVRGDMNHAGMAPVQGDAENGDNGVYTIPFEWTMGGDWILTITATLADGTEVTDEVEINGVSANAEATMDMDSMDMTEEADMNMDNMDMTEEPDMNMDMTAEPEGSNDG